MRLKVLIVLLATSIGLLFYSLYKHDYLDNFIHLINIQSLKLPQVTTNTGPQHTNNNVPSSVTTCSKDASQYIAAINNNQAKMSYRLEKIKYLPSDKNCYVYFTGTYIPKNTDEFPSTVKQYNIYNVSRNVMLASYSSDFGFTTDDVKKADFFKNYNKIFD